MLPGSLNLKEFSNLDEVGLTQKGGLEGMAKKLFVGGLSWETTDSDLMKAFALYGEVTEAKVITERDTGRCRGFGFVTFVRDEDAKTTISKIHGTSLDAGPLRLMRLRRRVLVKGAELAVAVGVVAIAGSQCPF